MGILQEVACAHCKEIVTDPITLNCTHHLCAEHVQNFCNRQVVECPICKAPTQVSEGGLKVDGVKKIVVNYLQGSEKSEAVVDRKDSEFVPPPVTCANCEDEVATLRCLDCRAEGAPLCDACSKQIHAQGLFTNHAFVDIHADVPQKDDLSHCDRMVCPEHGEKLDWYCSQCRCLVCSHCLIVGSHQSHVNQLPLDEAYKNLKDLLFSGISKMSHRVTDTKELLDNFELLEEEVTKNAETQREIVNGEMDRLRELVETKRAQLLGKAALEESQKRSELQMQMRRVEEICEEAQNLISRGEVLEATQSKQTFMVLVLQVIQDMTIADKRQVDHGRRVNTHFRELYTDHQVKTLGELDLGLAYAPQTLGGIYQVESTSSSATVHQHAWNHGGVMAPAMPAMPWGVPAPAAPAQHVVMQPPHAPIAPQHGQVIQVYRASLPPQGPS